MSAAICSLRSYMIEPMTTRTPLPEMILAPLFSFLTCIRGSFEMMASPAQPNLFGKVLILVNNHSTMNFQLFTDIEVNTELVLLKILILSLWSKFQC